MRKAAREYKLKKKLIYCRKCKTFYQPEDYYGIDEKTGKVKKYKNKQYFCHNCTRQINKKNNARYRAQHSIRELYNLKVEHIGPPGTYVSKTQMDNTFEILTSLKWKYNSINGIWYKEGIRNPDGSFVHLNDSTKKKRSSTRYEIIPLRLDL